MKSIVTVIGKDKPGIISKVSGMLSDYNINIEDISQTIMQGYFTMIMLVDISNSTVPFEKFIEKSKEIGHEIGVEIYIQHEDIFNTMHKI